MYSYFTVPYVVTIILALCSVGLWYYKLVYKDALATSYNAEIQKDGKQELFEDVYETYGSFKTNSSDTLDKVVVHEVSHKS